MEISLAPSWGFAHYASETIDRKITVKARKSNQGRKIIDSKWLGKGAVAGYKAHVGFKKFR